MDTDDGMQSLGSGGEAKASPADEADTEPLGPIDDLDVDQTERGTTMDTALDEDLAARDAPAETASWTIGPAESKVGYGETAAYGETAENAPAPTAGNEAE
jgi:hypothetical protein